MADEKKKAFIRNMVRRLQELDTIFDEAPDIESEYFDLGYNSGGANEIVAADVSIYVLTPTDIAAGITLIQQLKNMEAGSAVTTGNYGATTNIFKRAPV